MVDFDSEATIATPAIDVKRILVLQARQFVIDSLEAYYKSEQGGVSTEANIISSRVRSLFLEIRSGIRRHLKPLDYEKLVTLVKGKTAEDVEDAFDIMDTWLDTIGLTRIDVKQKLGGNLAERNKAQGWKG